jgi:predicted ribosomally synthesized peptide with SipW-like signal peptide
MSKKRVKQYLMLLTVIGLVAVAAGGSGTFASFSAEVTNTGNTFASGTLFLHNTDGVTTCTSESNSLNVNPGTGTGGDTCAVLFNASDFQGGAQTATIELDNAGTINASDIKFDVSGCTWGDNFSATNTHTLFGSAPTCGDMWLTVQETNSLGGTDVYCAYGPTTNNTDCDAPDNSATFANSTTLTALQTTGAVNADLAAGSPRYYTVTITPDSTLLSGNTLQNRTVAFDLNWKIDQ